MAPSGSTQPIEPSPTATSNGLPAGVTGNPIYFADFSAGWPTFNDPTAKIAIRNGQYRFEIGPFDGRFLNTTAIKQRDLYAQVDVSVESCPEKTGYGLMYRFKDSDNYYLLTVFCDSSYTAVAKINGYVSGMTNGKLPSGIDSAAITVHQVGVSVKGEDHTLYVDGQIAGTFKDDQLQQGDVAIYAVSQGAQVLKVSFDNLKVWTLQ